jgi:hypothetical protein
MIGIMFPSSLTNLLEGKKKAAYFYTHKGGSTIYTTKPKFSERERKIMSIIEGNNNEK